MYVIRRGEDGKYVARFGSTSSYTNKLQNAQTFSSKQDAEHHRCGNEYIESTGN